MLIVATHNSHKTGEMKKILGDLFPEITDLTSIPGLEPPVEDGETFSANSAIKALAASRDQPAAFILADDSGLEVDALEGAPGIYSSRYAGENASDAENREKLLAEMEGETNRTARFRCVVVIARGGKIIGEFDGAVEGRIAESMAGEGGFGYDPVFTPDGHDQTFGELSEEIKNGMSHRARALAKFREWWEKNKVTQQG